MSCAAKGSMLAADEGADQGAVGSVRTAAQVHRRLQQPQEAARAEADMAIAMAPAAPLCAQAVQALPRRGIPYLA